MNKDFFPPRCEKRIKGIKTEERGEKEKEQRPEDMYLKARLPFKNLDPSLRAGEEIHPVSLKNAEKRDIWQTPRSPNRILSPFHFDDGSE